MSETNIEWASHTLNFYNWACTKVSPGCKNCYAQTMAKRYGRDFDSPPIWRGKNAMKELKNLPAGAVVFVNSMSDTYHERVPVQWIHSIHNAALLRPDVTFLILTKRIERAYSLSRFLAYPPNLWLGTSVESDEYLWRLDYLLEIPAAGHFVSAEPLLSSIAGIKRYLYIDIKGEQFLPTITRRHRWLSEVHTFKLARYRDHRLGWVILGGESGDQRRPFSQDWAREVRDLCVDADVPFMFKQGSSFKPGQDRLLDGRTWDETPFQAVRN